MMESGLEQMERHELNFTIPPGLSENEAKEPIVSYAPSLERRW
jgi:hypothetical protein